MAIVIEKWPRRVEIYAWDESAPNLEAHLDQEHRVSDLSFLDLFDALTFLRNLAADSDLLVQLRTRQAYSTSSYREDNENQVIAQFAALLAAGTYRVRQYDFFRTAWLLQPPSPPAPPKPSPPSKRTDPPKPVENKAKLVEFVEIIWRGGVDGVVTGAGPASSELKTLTTRTDQKGSFYKQFINIVEKECDGIFHSHPEYGRYIEVKARVMLNGKPKGGETVEFSYKRQAGEYCPALITKDREGFNEPGSPATHTETTYEDGWTDNVRFYLSAYAGDTFELFAKGPDGKKLKLGTYQVWRKVWYQITKLKSDKFSRPTEAEALMEEVFVQMEFANTVELTEATAPSGSIYPAWMMYQWEEEIREDSPSSKQKVLVLGEHNDRKFFSLLQQKPGQPVKAHFIVCEALWTPETEPAPVEVFSFSSSDYIIPLNIGGFSDRIGVFKPTLDGKPLVIQASWSSDGRTGALTDDNIKIPKGRGFANQVAVNLPVGAPDPKVHPVQVTLQLRTAISSNKGHSNGVHIVIENGEIGQKKTPKERVLLNRAVAHELGHSFNQVPLPGFQPKPLPNHPNRYSEKDASEYEWHCKTGAILAYADPDSTDDDYPSDWQIPSQLSYFAGTCIMFGGVFPKKAKFCAICHPYIRLQNMEKLEVGKN